VRNLELTAGAVVSSTMVSIGIGTRFNYLL
jgi:hypothetical protein